MPAATAVLGGIDATRYGDRVIPDQEQAMACIDGLVAAVPSANRQQYIEHAQTPAAPFKLYGGCEIIVDS